MGLFQFTERDNCGVGLLLMGMAIPLHDILIKGIAALIKLSHRAERFNLMDALEMVAGFNSNS